ncbi:mannose-1-phosphate guanylyltransferase [Aquipuribacter nitratireducens]|uniref:Mannose-1-phosphate guanylyltransferase n=1 Tax=Aquipuribacter nitratireducens TaxID=650104 RepID=A0ABW0GLF9_9MICO
MSASSPDRSSPPHHAAGPAPGRLPGFHAVVPAGGAGTRLWPLSRAARPKFLLDLTGSGRTLVQATWDRLVPLAGESGVVVVTGTQHAVAVARQLPGLGEADLVVEPAPRNSAAAIGVVAAVLAARDPDAVLGSFAADHVIGDVDSFHAAVAEAVAAAREGWLVTIGMQPTGPSTGFGYVSPGEALAVPGAPSLHRVVRFVEKPDAATAERYVAEGWRWNAGMFVVRAAVLLDLLAEHAPELAEGLRRIGEAWDTPQRETVLDATWPGLPSLPIDTAVAEPAADAGRVAVVPGSFRWDDVGDWTSLGDLLGPAGDGAGVPLGDPGEGLRVLGDPGRVVCKDATGVVVPSGGRLVVLSGVDDVVVVDTLDAVLVTTRERAQEVKDVVDILKREGRTDLV